MISLLRPYYNAGNDWEIVALNTVLTIWLKICVSHHFSATEMCNKCYNATKFGLQLYY